MNNREQEESSSLVQPGSPSARRRRLARGAVSRQASAEPNVGLQTQLPPSDDTTRLPRRACIIILLSVKDIDDLSTGFDEARYRSRGRIGRNQCGSGCIRGCTH